MVVVHKVDIIGGVIQNRIDVVNSHLYTTVEHIEPVPRLAMETLNGVPLNLHGGVGIVGGTGVNAVQDVHQVIFH